MEDMLHVVPLTELHPDQLEKLFPLDIEGAVSERDVPPDTVFE